MPEANRPNMSDLTNKMTGIHDMMRAGVPGEPGTSLMKTSNDAQRSRSSRRASEQCEVRGNSLDTTTVYPRMMAGLTREYESGHPGSLESFRPENLQTFGIGKYQTTQEPDNTTCIFLILFVLE
jgi:hypothetical protein